MSIDEFMSLPELQQNPLVQRVIDIFDEDGNGEVDFKGPCLQRIIFFGQNKHFVAFIFKFSFQNLFKVFHSSASKEIKNLN